MNRAQILADYFKAHADVWIDGRDLAVIAGAYAWRTRASQCRQWYGMQIDNRQRRVKRADGSFYIVSEYKFVTPDTATKETTKDATTGIVASGLLI